MASVFQSKVTYGILVLSAILCVSSLAMSGERITIGVLCPLTGPYSFEAISQKNFAYMAAEEINASGGILGRQIDIVIENTELKAGVGAKKAKQLIQQGVKYITGGVSSNVTSAVSKIAHEAGIIHLGIGGSNALTGKACNKHHFNLDTAAYQMAMGTGRYLLSQTDTSNQWFSITADYSWGHSCLKSVREVLHQYNGKLVGNVMVPLRETDFSEALLKAAVSNASVLCVIVYGTGQGKLLQQAYEFGITNKKMKVVVIVSDLTVALNTKPEALQEVYVGLPWYWKIDNQTTRALAEKYIARYGQPPAWPGVQVYDSIKVIAKATNIAGTFDVPAVISVLEGLEFQTSKGLEKIRSCDHRAIQDWYVGRGKNPGKMENKWDVFEIVGQIRGEQIMYSCEDTGCSMNRE